jgi:hypothetical protein
MTDNPVQRWHAHNPAATPTHADLKKGAAYAVGFADGHKQADRIEALTEQLEAARADAKEAEDYAEELEKARERLALAICGGEDAPGYANAQTVETLERVARDNASATMEQINRTLAAEAKLAKAVEAVSLTVRADNLREAYHALPNDHNRIGDKRSRKGHAREAWLRAFRKAAKTSRAVLAEIEGEKG